MIKAYSGDAQSRLVSPGWSVPQTFQHKAHDQFSGIFRLMVQLGCISHSGWNQCRQVGLRNCFASFVPYQILLICGFTFFSFLLLVGKEVQCLSPLAIQTMWLARLKGLKTNALIFTQVLVNFFKFTNESKDGERSIPRSKVFETRAKIVKMVKWTDLLWPGDYRLRGLRWREQACPNRHGNRGSVRFHE